jgi:hypothetical protein
MATANTAARKAKIADLKSQLKAARAAEREAHKLQLAAERTHTKAFRARYSVQQKLASLSAA